LRPGARWRPPARLFSHSSNLLLRHSPCSAARAANAPRVMRGEQLSKPQIGPIRLSRQRRPLTAGRTSGGRAKGGLRDPKCPAASALALSVRQRQNRIRQIRDGLTARRAVCERPQFAHLSRLSDVSNRREAAVMDRGSGGRDSGGHSCAINGTHRSNLHLYSITSSAGKAALGECCGRVPGMRSATNHLEQKWLVSPCEVCMCPPLRT
jgi:hypothetical protein